MTLFYGYFPAILLLGFVTDISAGVTTASSGTTLDKIIEEKLIKKKFLFETTTPTLIPEMNKTQSDLDILTAAEKMEPPAIQTELSADLDSWKSVVEDFQPEDLSPQPDELEEQFHHIASEFQLNEVYAEDIETLGTNLDQGHITAILVGVLLVACILAYAGLVSWRAYLERRYGNRERLITHDDYYNNNDIRHIDL